MPAIPLTSLGFPVVSERLNTQALIPDGQGSGTWIAQFYTFPDNNPGEWIIADLASGTYTRQDGGGSWLNKKYPLTGFKVSNQLWAPNGYVFFGALSTCWYDYNPNTRLITQHPQLPFLPGENWHDDSDYDLIFNVDGSKLYGGTIAAAGVSDHRPQLFEIDPNTRAVTQYGRVGSTQHSLAAYAYYVHADGLASPWVYTLVGEDIWDAVATNTTTGASTILIQGLTSAPWMTFTERPEGLVLNVYTNKNQPSQTLAQYWIVDGQLYPYTFPYDPNSLPFTPRTVTAYTRPLVQPPQIDTSLAPVAVRWRPYGSSGAWTELDFTLEYVAPVAIDGMAVAPDGSILFIAQEYEGWARYVPPASQATFLGQGSAVADVCFSAARGLLYVAGYPNGTFYAYDPSAPYDKGVTNPKFLGEFSTGDSLSGVKTAHRLAYDAGNQRMYMAGTRDRSGFGAGIGDYDFLSKIFGGTFANLADDTSDVSVAVFDTKVVLGAQTGDGAAASLVIYDLNLNQTSTQTPNAAWSDTGRLFRTTEPTVVIGISAFEQVAYRWDIGSQSLLATVDLSPYGALVAASLCDNGDGTVTMQLGGSLATLDLTTLGVTVEGTLPGGTTLGALVVSGGTHYTAVGAQIYRVGDSPIDYSIDTTTLDLALTWGESDLEVGVENELDTETLTLALTWGSSDLSVGNELDTETMILRLAWGSVHFEVFPPGPIETGPFVDRRPPSVFTPPDVIIQGGRGR